MTLVAQRFEEVTPTVLVANCMNSVQVSVSSAQQASVRSEADTASFYGLISISGMNKTAVPVGKFVAQNFSALNNVQAVLAGESADVLHVWIMIDEWTPEARKQVYSIQKTVMRQLEGLHFDFYVVDLPHGTNPQEMVSDIPVVFHRAEQESTSSNC
ncbi:MAG: hypothetical protein WBQ08_08925 [Candidatus Sulfotelmatobacter sp.]